MNLTRIPPKLKRTPTTEPEVFEHWQHLYDELITIYPKSRALEIIGNKYGVSRQTVMYHLFPDYKENQKKQLLKKWSYEKHDPIIKKRITDYKAKYMNARRHIIDLVKESYQRAAPQEALTLGNLRDAIFEMSGIAFQPSTLEGLVKRFEATKGYSLLVGVPGHNVPLYRLSDKFHK